MGRRVGLVTIDQAVSGGSNVLLALLAVQVLSPAGFGLFAIVLTTYITAMGIARALVCDPVLVHPEQAAARPGHAIGSAWVVGGATGLLVAAGGAAATTWETPLAHALWVLAACMPFLVVQDAGRYLAFTTRRPGRALALDVTWLAVQVVALTAVLLSDRHGLATFVATWSVSGAVAGVGACLQNRRGNQRPSTAWLRGTWGFSWRYLIAYGATNGGALAVSVSVGAIAGARALGGLQGALLLTRPFQTVQIGAVASSTAEISASGGDPELGRVVAARATAVAVVAALVNSAVLVLLPDSLGTLVLSETWAAAEPLLWAASGQMVAMSLLVGSRAGLIGTRSVRTSMTADLISTAVLLGAVVAAVSVWGIVGGMWAVAGVHSINAACQWGLFEWRLRHPEPAVGSVAVAAT